MTPPLIAWEEVPDGAYVWFRHPGDKWQHGCRQGDRVAPSHGWGYYTPARLEFCHAEQQPGERDAEWRGWGIVEVAIRNPSVSDYMNHWEGRALKAEADLATLKAEVEELRQRDRVISRQIERHASGDDPLAHALREDRDKFEGEVKRLKAGIARLEQEMRQRDKQMKRALAGDVVSTGYGEVADRLAALREGRGARHHRACRGGEGMPCTCTHEVAADQVEQESL